jgi:hypothetical protein
MVEELNLWSAGSYPFKVSYLNIEPSLRLEGVHSRVVDFVLKHRPDIIFLGELDALDPHSHSSYWKADWNGT